MVWGCFSGKGLGPLVKVDGKMNRFGYIDILEKNLLSFIKSKHRKQPYAFQDDNAPVHRASAVNQWKESNSVLSLPWPAQSPDLNPIEHLWDVLERKVRVHKPHPKNIRELMIVLEEE